MESSGQGSARATWLGFDTSIMRCCCDRLRLFVRVIYHGKCILLRCCWRRLRGELHDKGEGLDNPLFAEGTRCELRGIGLLYCGKLVAFSMAWHGERVIELVLAKMFISGLSCQGSNKTKREFLDTMTDKEVLISSCWVCFDGGVTNDSGTLDTDTHICTQLALTLALALTESHWLLLIPYLFNNLPCHVASYAFDAVNHQHQYQAA